MNLIKRLGVALVAISMFLAPALGSQNSIVTPVVGPLTMAQYAAIVNLGFNTVASNYSGTTPPAVGASGSPIVWQFWVDTSTNPRVLRMYDGTAWVAIGSLDDTSHAFSFPISSLTNDTTGTTYTFADADKNTFKRFTNAGAVAATLPQAGVSSQFLGGWFMEVRYTGNASLTITPTVSTIDGAASLTLTPGKSCRIYSTSTNYVTTCSLGTPTTSVLGGVFQSTAVANQWLTGIDATGTFTRSQPAASDLSNGVTGSGAVVLQASPTLTTPVLGAATATTINGLTITSSSGGVLTISSGKTLSIANSLALSGTDGTSFAFPVASDTLLGRGSTDTITGNKSFADGRLILNGSSSGSTVLKATAAAAGTLTFPAVTDVISVLGTAQTWTAIQSFNDGMLSLKGSSSGNTILKATAAASGTVTLPAATGTVTLLELAQTITAAKTFNDLTMILAGSSSGTTTLKASATASGTLTLPAATDTLMGKATTDVMLNKTYDTAGTGNSFSIAGVGVTANTGTGAMARAVSPVFTTPTLGVATATSINGNTITTGTGTLTLGTGKTLTASNSVTLAGTDGSTLTYGAGGTIAYVANNLSVFAATTSAQLRGVISDETGTGALVFATAPTISAPVVTDMADFQGAVKRTGVSSPTQITSNQNDYNPGSVICISISTLRVNSDATRNITGLAGGVEGCLLNIVNVGTNPIVLADQDAGSSVGNRFAIGGNATLAAAGAYSLRYDGTSSRWRPTVTPGAGGGGGGVSSVSCAEGTTCTTITSSGTVKATFGRFFMLSGM